MFVLGLVGEAARHREWCRLWIDGARDAQKKCGAFSKLQFESADCDRCGGARNRHPCASDCAQLRHAAHSKSTFFPLLFFVSKTNWANFEVFVHRVGRVGRGNAQLDAKQRFYAYSIVSTMDVSHMCDVHLFLNKPLKNRFYQSSSLLLSFLLSFPVSLIPICESIACSGSLETKIFSSSFSRLVLVSLVVTVPFQRVTNRRSVSIGLLLWSAASCDD